jgi:hypothetical protein
MKEIAVKRVAPAQLPVHLIYLLGTQYHTKLTDFVVIYDKKEECLYINSAVQEDAAQKFVKYASFEGPCINNDEEDGGLGCLGEYIYDVYGADALSILFDAWKNRREEKGMEEARGMAGQILPLIKKLDRSEEPPVQFNDCLAYYISRAGSETKHKTFHNAVGYGAKYIFWLGYLAGTGQLQEEP